MYTAEAGGVEKLLKHLRGSLQGSSDVMKKDNSLERLERAIERLHDCNAIHADSVPVQEIVDGRTLWQGIVEVFTLIAHPKAKRCFAWPHREGRLDLGQPFHAVLEIPPIDSPRSAVHVTLISAARKRA